MQLEELFEMELSAEDMLKLHIKGVITVYFRYPYINRLIHFLFEGPPSGRKVAETINKPLAATRRKQGVASNVFREVNPMLLYFIVLSACDHLFFGKQKLRTAFGVDEIDAGLRQSYTSTLLDVLMNGMLTSRAANWLVAGGPVPIDPLD